ncbi:MAG TPA: DUF4390 domain-containing protein [Casimicrobiaceae bacterium]|nr:DUF4390 domain-containing protein [Casimicrobiaceae bacterium]
MRKTAIALAAVLTLLVAAPAARADTIPVNNVDVRVDEDSVVLNADFDVSFNPTLEEALQKGVPLYFLLEVEILRPRRYWFDDKVMQRTTQYRVSWLPLTRQYRVSSGLLSQTYDSLQEVERLIGRVNARSIANLSDLERGVRYEAIVRLRLDPNQLPKPFQVNALASRDWQLASDARRAAFTP